ncbi:MAG: HRDC domain-containing protein, partial [Planctomycetota bacterium]
GIERVAKRLKSVRSRHRRGRHAEAHEAKPQDEKRRRGVKKRLFADDRVPSKDAELVDDADGLAEVLAHLRGDDIGSPRRFAYDTEFIGETSYHPKLCLLQVGTCEKVYLVDPLAEMDTGPLLALLVDPSIQKIVHAGEQDLEPVARLTGKVPANVIDTQIAAAFCGLPYPASLAKLVEHVSSCVMDDLGSPGGGLKLGKGYTFTQWDARPLSGKQLAYAADDVRYLPIVLDWIEGQLDASEERQRWMRAECDLRCQKAADEADAEPWERLRGYGGIDDNGRPILRALARWRDSAAREADLPPRALVRDDVLVYLAKNPPKPGNKQRIGEIRHMPKPVAEQFGDAIMAAIDAGRDQKDDATPDHQPYEPSLADKFAADAVWAKLQSLAYDRGLDPNLVASRRDVEGLLRRHAEDRVRDDELLLTGWRGEAVGQAWAEAVLSSS